MPHNEIGEDELKQIYLILVSVLLFLLLAGCDGGDNINSGNDIDSADQYTRLVTFNICRDFDAWLTRHFDYHLGVNEWDDYRVSSDVYSIIDFNESRSSKTFSARVPLGRVVSFHIDPYKNGLPVDYYAHVTVNPQTIIPQGTGELYLGYLCSVTNHYESLFSHCFHTTDGECLLRPN